MMDAIPNAGPEATALIADGKIELDIPFVSRTDEIGHLARAVRNFRDAACRNLELEQLEIGTAKQRDTAMGERDKLADKYHATKWQLSAAINSMPQGMIMLDPAAMFSRSTTSTGKFTAPRSWGRRRASCFPRRPPN
jgi:hypothetical protein